MIAVTKEELKTILDFRKENGGLFFKKFPITEETETDFRIFEKEEHAELCRNIYDGIITLIRISPYVTKENKYIDILTEVWAKLSKTESDAQFKKYLSETEKILKGVKTMFGKIAKENKNVELVKEMDKFIERTVMTATKFAANDDIDADLKDLIAAGVKILEAVAEKLKTVTDVTSEEAYGYACDLFDAVKKWREGVTSRFLTFSANENLETAVTEAIQKWTALKAPKKANQKAGEKIEAFIKDELISKDDFDEFGKLAAVEADSRKFFDFLHKKEEELSANIADRKKSL